MESQADELQPKNLIRRVKWAAGIVAVTSLVSFFSGPSIFNVLWLVLAILTFRATNKRRASSKILKVFSCCTALSAVCAFAAAIAVAVLGSMLVSCACSQACTSDTWAVVLANQAHLNNITSHLHLPPTDDEAPAVTDVSATFSATLPFSASSSYSATAAVEPKPSSAPAPASRRAAFPDGPLSAFSLLPRLASSPFAASILHPIPLPPRRRRAFDFSDDAPGMPVPSSSRVIIVRGGGGGGSGVWHGLRITSSSQLSDEVAPADLGSEDAFSPRPFPFEDADEASEMAWDDAPRRSHRRRPAIDVDEALTSLLGTARAWLDMADALRHQDAAEATEPVEASPDWAAAAAPALSPSAPRFGRVPARALLSKGDRHKATGDHDDKYPQRGGGGGHPRERDHEEDETEEGDLVELEQPESVGAGLLLKFAGGESRTVTERQFLEAAGRVCAAGNGVVAAVVIALFVVAALYAIASSSAARLAKHPWYVEAVAARRAARFGGGFPPAVFAGSALPVAVALSAASVAPQGPAPAAAAAMPDERTLYRFVPGHGFVPAQQPLQAAPAQAPIIPGDARPLRHELSSVLASASSALASMLRPRGSGYEAVPSSSAADVQIQQQPRLPMQGQAVSFAQPPAGPPPPPAGSAASYELPSYVPSPYAQAYGAPYGAPQQ